MFFDKLSSADWANIGTTILAVIGAIISIIFWLKKNIAGLDQLFTANNLTKLVKGVANQNKGLVDELSALKFKVNGVLEQNKQLINLNTKLVDQLDEVNKTLIAKAKEEEECLTNTNIAQTEEL